MQLSLQADYSCRVLIFLATKIDQSSINEIASAFDISKNHLVKVVHQLGKLGYVETTRGRGGGIRLARSANTISIGDVIRQTEPHLDIVECFNSETNTCPIVSACGLKPWLAKATAAFLATLEGVTIADVAAAKKKLGKTLGIKIET